MKNSKSSTFNDAMKVASNYSASLIEIVNDPIFIINQLYIITNVNAAAVFKTEVAREQLIGSEIVQYFTAPDKIKKICEEIFKNGFVTDKPFVLMDGQLTEVLISGSTYGEDDHQTTGAVILAKDITEKKRIEKELNWYMDRM